MIRSLATLRVIYIYIIYCHSVSLFSVLQSTRPFVFSITLYLHTQSLIIIGRDLDEPYEIARHSANGTS